MPDLLLLGGSLIVGAAAAQAGWLALDGVRRGRATASRRAFETQELAWRVEAARKKSQLIHEEVAWTGWRKFEVTRKVAEAENICSVYLAPHDGKALPTFRAGQFLTFRLQVPGELKPVVRCYSLSHKPDRATYRVSIKRIGAPPGVVDARPGVASSYFHDHVHPGDVLDVRSPSGHFCLDADVTRPVVLVGGGIGLTPLLSIAHWLAGMGEAAPEAHLVLGFRHSGEHPFKDELDRLTKAYPRLHLHVCYGQAAAGDVLGRDYTHVGNADVGFLRSILPSSNFEFYVCGPPPMMNALKPALLEWGVPEASIHHEAFGPASIVQAKGPATTTAGGPEASLEIVFEKSGRTLSWNAQAGTLLELASREGIVLDAGCRAGNCGTCAVAVKSGTVTYRTNPGVTVEDGTCLTCCSVPASRLVLSA